MVTSAALVGGKVTEYTPDEDVTVSPEAVPWIVPSALPSNVCPPIVIPLVA